MEYINSFIRERTPFYELRENVNVAEHKLILKLLKSQLIFYTILSFFILLLFYNKVVERIRFVYGITILFILGFILILFQLQSTDIYNYKIYVFYFILFVISVYTYRVQNYNAIEFMIPLKITVFLFVLFIIIGILIFYKVFLIYLKKQQGIVGIIINLILFIPCTIDDILEYFKTQYNITTNTTYILLLIEFIILFCYFYFYTNTIKDNSPIMTNPVYLSKKYVIADNNVSTMTPSIHSLFKLDKSKSNTSSIKQINNYSVSFWVYINQNNGIYGDHNIFHFGQVDKTTDNPVYGRPTVSYNSDNHKYTISMFNNEINVSNVPIQRWNYFVIVFYETNAYLYINGKLENTIEKVLTLESFENPTKYENNYTDIIKNEFQSINLNYLINGLG